jgi:hypothetical protein
MTDRETKFDQATPDGFTADERQGRATPGVIQTRRGKAMTSIYRTRR